MGGSTTLLDNDLLRTSDEDLLQSEGPSRGPPAHLKFSYSWDQQSKEKFKMNLQDVLDFFDHFDQRHGHPRDHISDRPRRLCFIVSDGPDLLSLYKEVSRPPQSSGPRETHDTSPETGDGKGIEDDQTTVRTREEPKIFVVGLDRSILQDTHVHTGLKGKSVPVVSIP